MGIYLNPGPGAFMEALNSPIYVDKTNLMRITNRALASQRKYMCISRPRQFGKSMAANMLSAYYDHTVDGDALFHGLSIASDAAGMAHQGKYDVLRINMQDFLSGARPIKGSGDLLQAVFDGNETAVAAGVEAAHLETSHIQYNDENALSYTLSLAFYSARRYYTLVREMPAGKGFADLTLLPQAAARG